jgi:hypothetical protein
MAESLFLSTDHHIKVTGLQDEDSAAYLNAATITYAVKNEDGDTITGGTGSLSYVAASNGNYLGVIQSTVLVTNSAVPLTEFEEATVVVTISQGDYNDETTLTFEVRKRGEW